MLVRLDSMPFSASFRVTSSRTLRTTSVNKERETEIYENEKKPRTVKINSDSYAKRTISLVAATPARQSDRVSRTSRTPRTNAFRLFERAHLAVGACSRRQLWPTIPTGLSQARSHVSPYTELRQQIHDDLRFQHPDWVQPNGESPICDSYEARLMELIDPLTGTDVERVQKLPMV